MIGVRNYKHFTAFVFVFLLSAYTCFAQEISSQLNPSIKLTKTKIFDNNAASFSEKYNLISTATQTIDMIYFIIDNDYSTSLFFQNVIQKLSLAHKQGTPLRVRVLVDYFMSEKQLPFFRLLESYGIQIKRYGGPDSKWVEDLKNFKINSESFLSGLMAQDLNLLKSSLPEDLKESFKDTDFSKLKPEEKISFILSIAQRIGPNGPKIYKGLRNFLYRTHHKLLLIDGNCFMTGGRNLSDEYHSSRGDVLIDGNSELGIQARHYPFQDTDVSSCLKNSLNYSESPLTQSFERLWNHSLNVNLQTNFTAAERDTSNVTKSEELHRKAELARHLLKTNQSFYSLEKEDGLDAEYIENIMTPTSLINSGITDHYTKLFNSLEGGDEASFVNAYFYLDPKIFTNNPEKDLKMKLLYNSLIGAAQRKAKLTIHTNSLTTTDLSIVNVMSYPFYRFFINEKILIKELSKRPDLDQGSLHKKTAYFHRPQKNDVLIVGSYNLDARSHYKDTNVALSIQIPKELSYSTFEAYKKHTSESIQWDELDPDRLKVIDDTIVNDKNKIKLRRFLFPFKTEI